MEVNFNEDLYEFPDDASDDEIISFFNKQDMVHRPEDSFSEFGTVAGIPGPIIKSRIESGQSFEDAIYNPIESPGVKQGKLAAKAMEGIIDIGKEFLPGAGTIEGAKQLEQGNPGLAALNTASDLPVVGAAGKMLASSIGFLGAIRGVKRIPPLYHGTRPSYADVIIEQGFTRGRSAELGIPGVSVSEDPIVSLDRFAKPDTNREVFQGMLAVNLDVDPSEIYNLRPSEYFAGDLLVDPKTTKAYKKPNPMHEAETFLIRDIDLFKDTDSDNPFLNLDTGLTKIKTNRRRLTKNEIEELKKRADTYYKAIDARGDLQEILSWKGLAGRGEKSFAARIVDTIDLSVKVKGKGFSQKHIDELARTLSGSDADKLLPYLREELGSNQFADSFINEVDNIAQIADAHATRYSDYRKLVAEYRDTAAFIAEIPKTDPHYATSIAELKDKGEIIDITHRMVNRSREAFRGTLEEFSKKNLNRKLLTKP